ncbi:MAG: MerR family transcriptional regulator [Clostridia bacterium]|nr:MerR family transcriptional regulator [Clostridia bacterium]
MSQYTTGEMAKLCDITVRTVQFYDERGLLHPSELTEGGRRLYSDENLARLRLICLLKSLGLSLDAIMGVLQSETSTNVLLLILDEQLKTIDSELSSLHARRKAIATIRQSITNGEIKSVTSMGDIDAMMKGKEKLKRTRIVLLAVGLVIDVFEFAALIYWIRTGVWQPFAIVMPLVLISCALLIRMYYKATAYICPVCNERFKPTLKQFFFSNHTPKTRKLTCTHCGQTDWCVETYQED